MIKRVRLNSDKLGSGLGDPEDKSRGLLLKRHRAGKHGNALKHGVFANIIILPWEDPEEFRILHTEVVPLCGTVRRLG